MTSRSSKGRAALNRALNKTARRAQKGQGRVSKALGANDPRMRRHEQNRQRVDKTLGAGLTYDRQGRLTTEDT